MEPYSQVRSSLSELLSVMDGDVLIFRMHQSRSKVASACAIVPPDAVPDRRRDHRTAAASVTSAYTKQLDRDRERTDRPNLEDHGDRFGPEACYSWVQGSSTLLCRQGPLIFDVSGAGYGRFPGVPTDLNARAKHWRDKVQGPVAQIIATKLP
ncbi:hypothetical protein K1W54_25160 [Micromonospora sp. CPCC 205371]|nr:hypothetical protein [Micromonospora sp. CPCC 205371]